MKILLVGNGGRENALAWKIYSSKSFQTSNGRLYNTLGNPGINKFAEPVNVKPEAINLLTEFALNENIDFTVVGPEVPLSLGIVDEFEKNELKIFGPKKSSAEIESSKIFAKNLMNNNNIPTAKYNVFSKSTSKLAYDFLNTCQYPVVVKADGLAAGKGVIIVNNFIEAKSAIEKFTVSDLCINQTGVNFIIEEFLSGEEISVFAITDGNDYIILPFSQDHKKIFDKERGSNTGGMGAIAPIKKFMQKSLVEKIKNKIIEPVLNALKETGREYKGCLYCGLTIVEDEPYVIEFNCRFGDPETQAVLPLIKSDFLQMLIDSASNNIKNYKLELNDEYTCSVVLVSDGYPGAYEINKAIKGIDEVKDNCLVFHSGTKYDESGKNVLSNGGRVLSIVGTSNISLSKAIEIAYTNVHKINFENKYYRKDIGFRQFVSDKKEAVN